MTIRTTGVWITKMNSIQTGMKGAAMWTNAQQQILLVIHIIRQDTAFKLYLEQKQLIRLHILYSDICGIET